MHSLFQQQYSRLRRVAVLLFLQRQYYWWQKVAYHWHWYPHCLLLLFVLLLLFLRWYSVYSKSVLRPFSRPIRSSNRQWLYRFATFRQCWQVRLFVNLVPDHRQDSLIHRWLHRVKYFRLYSPILKSVCRLHGFLPRSSNRWAWLHWHLHLLHWQYRRAVYPMHDDRWCLPGRRLEILSCHFAPHWIWHWCPHLAGDRY